MQLIKSIIESYRFYTTLLKMNQKKTSQYCEVFYEIIVNY